MYNIPYVVCIIPRFSMYRISVPHKSPRPCGVTPPWLVAAAGSRNLGQGLMVIEILGSSGEKYLKISWTYQNILIFLFGYRISKYHHDICLICCAVIVPLEMQISMLVPVNFSINSNQRTKVLISAKLLNRIIQLFLVSLKCWLSCSAPAAPKFPLSPRSQS